MADFRVCVQCEDLFAPAREHARFCSADCRIAWNRQNSGVPGTGDGVLEWSVAAMRDTTGRLLRTRSLSRPAGYVMISEAVWWCTMVEATLVRYHPDTHAAALAMREALERRAIENTFGGLRFVRNRMGYKVDHGDFLEASGADGQITAWTWKQIPDEALSDLARHAKEWEQTRYRAYRTQLADRRIGDTFSQAASFLKETAECSLAPDRA
jgi:hypothetical protein